MPTSKLVLAALASACWLASGPARGAESADHGFLQRVFTDTDGTQAKYQVFIPFDYRGDRAFPCILFLHGSGESGTDGAKQVKVGLGPAIRRQERTFPFIAVFPQSAHRTWQARSADGRRALAILDAVEKEFRVDRERVYLTGLSMGGFGTFSFAAAAPERWAAIVPICGGGDLKLAARIKQIPCWCFHGGADGVVNVSYSRKMIQALKEAGGDPKYTEFPKTGHNCWDKAYATADLFPWLRKQRSHQ